ncbi:hypothetical protein EA007_00050 [Vibrio anguillarum]|uniref:hypothetical protein n=6 Tax=Vibrio anguillarum TaxID=55601 RepID=UPI00188BF994|nr:hypothetical protein [Vibrio anguillarum]MBF4249422.1 hypothetical protein [Vibrio anguillarum]
MKATSIKLTLSTMILISALSGCSTAPSPEYDIQMPIQTSMDSIKSTRHFNSVNDYTPSLTEEWFKKYPVTVVNNKDWQQLLIKANLNADSKYQLERNLSRTCWAIKSDAEIRMMSSAYRGIKDENVISACISKRLGSEYPLFIFSHINDPIIGEYFMLLTPRSIYSDRLFACKAKQEGYNFKSQMYCQ